MVLVDSTVNWEKFGVKIFSLAQSTMKIKLTKNFRQYFIKAARVNLRYEKSCDVHTKALLLTG